jgi:uncharacterized protein YndB with AHSA1/START domain
MSENERAVASGTGPYRRVEVKRVVNASIDDVWDAITDADKVSQWWDPGEIDRREGGRVRLGTNTDECGGLPLDGVIKVFQPPHVLEFTWHEQYDPAMGLVRFDLVELGPGKTEVTLVNFVPEGDVIFAAAGWHEITERLQQYMVVRQAIPPAENDGRYKELCSFYQESLATTAE